MIYICTYAVHTFLCICLIFTSQLMFYFCQVRLYSPFSIEVGCVQPITGQVTEVTCPVIGRAQPELTPSKRLKTGPVQIEVELCDRMALSAVIQNIGWTHTLPFVVWQSVASKFVIAAPRQSAYSDRSATRTRVHKLGFLGLLQGSHWDTDCGPDQQQSQKYPESLGEDPTGQGSI